MLQRQKHQLLLALVAAALLAGCSSTSSTTSHDVSGKVIDSRTQKPIAGATVTVASDSVTTDDSGHFTLRKVSEGKPVSVSSKYYRTTQSTAVPKHSPYVLSVAIDPVPVQVKVQSNLNAKPMPATIVIGGTRTAAPKGLATLYGTGAGASIRVQAPDYLPKTQALRGDVTSVTLEAGPKPTALHLADAWKSQKYKMQADLVHPSVLKYVTREQLLSGLRQPDLDGYSTIRFEFISQALLPRWQWTGCSGRGATTFRRVAAVEYVRVTSAPDGGSEKTRGVMHLVNAKGHWTWFPIVPGCE